jgi:hypothetical protein
MMYGSAEISNIPGASYMVRAFSTGKVAVPVAPSNFIYSHFEHVVGIPAPEGTQGVAVSKLKILDVLIDQLSQLKKKADPSLGSTDTVSDDRLDALIEQYEKEIRGARAASLAMPYLPRPSAPAGAVFNLVA